MEINYSFCVCLVIKVFEGEVLFRLIELGSEFGFFVK